MEEQRKARKRRKFTEEFKARAVRLVLTEGQSVAQVARGLDLSDSVLHDWLQKAKTDRGVGPPGATGALVEDERDELVRLRRENRILKEEKEILRKAAAFFAKEDR